MGVGGVRHSGGLALIGFADTGFPNWLVVLTDIIKKSLIIVIALAFAIALSGFRVPCILLSVSEYIGSMVLPDCILLSVSTIANGIALIRR